jgi:hypothetical protein
MSFNVAIDASREGLILKLGPGISVTVHATQVPPFICTFTQSCSSGMDPSSRTG